MKRFYNLFVCVTVVMLVMVAVNTVSTFSKRLDKIEARQEAISTGLDYLTETQVADKKELKKALEKKQNKINYLFKD